MSDANARWLDAEAAARYISVRTSALARLVKMGRIPAPTRNLGDRSPRWDRLALDAAFGGGAESTDARLAFQGLADEIAAKGQKSPTDRSPHAHGRHRQGISLRPAQGQAQGKAG